MEARARSRRFKAGNLETTTWKRQAVANIFVECKRKSKIPRINNCEKRVDQNQGGGNYEQ